MNRKTLLMALLFGGLIGCNGGNWSSGDRVLVAKCLYDTHAETPHRYEVVVFKYPVTPIEKGTPKNYIKRLIGLPGEIIAIFFGRLYRFNTDGVPDCPYRKEDEGEDPLRLWQHLHDTDPYAKGLFEAGKFEMLRKPPDIMLSLRRIVFDNDFQPRDLDNIVRPRWDAKPTKGWKAFDNNKSFQHKGDIDAVDWLRYQHLVVERSSDHPVQGPLEVRPQLITDRMGYNSFTLESGMDMTPAPNWVGDLMLEFDVEVQRSQGELHVELSKGINRFQARFKLDDGVCKLVRIDPTGKEEELGQGKTGLVGTGEHTIRFANVDARLTVWVGRELPFGEGRPYAPPEVRAPGENIDEGDLLERRGPTANDLQPASIGSKGAVVAIKHVRLWRDTYYTVQPSGPDAHLPRGEAWSNPQAWEPLRKQTYRTLFVQPGHYLCLGDNSTASSDSRDWGLVPERLLLGRAMAVYYPLNRLGPIK
jgi:signal peptidase I